MSCENRANAGDEAWKLYALDTDDGRLRLLAEGSESDVLLRDYLEAPATGSCDVAWMACDG